MHQPALLHDSPVLENHRRKQKGSFPPPPTKINATPGHRRVRTVKWHYRDVIRSPRGHGLLLDVLVRAGTKDKWASVPKARFSGQMFTRARRLNPE